MVSFQISHVGSSYYMNLKDAVSNIIISIRGRDVNVIQRLMNSDRAWHSVRVHMDSNQYQRGLPLHIFYNGTGKFRGF